MSQAGWATKARWAGKLAWASYLLLVSQQLVDVWIHGAPWIIWVAKLIPLLIFLPGMLRDHLRSYLWLCFVSLGYFTSLVERIFAQPGSPLVVTGLVAVIVLFCSAMFYVRWRARALKAAVAESPADCTP